MSTRPESCRRRLPLADCIPEMTTVKQRRLEHGPCQQADDLSSPTQQASSKSINTTTSPRSQILRLVEQLFGSDVVGLPCIFARIVACFTLAHGQSSLDSQLQTLCEALVQVEAASLQSTVTVSSPRAKKISFCSFDCSASLPPVDRVEGSEHHQYQLIHRLLVAKRAMDGLEATITSSNCSTLQQFVAFLSDDENSPSWIQNCAASIPGNFPTARIQSARKLYLLEFETLLTRINNKSANTIMFARLRNDPVLPLEHRLAHFVGQAIRRELRHLLYPPPPRGCSKDVHYEQRASLFSQAYKHVHFQGQLGAAAVDQNLVTLVSAALDRLYAYFGHDVLLQTDVNALYTQIPDGFCASEASMTAIPVNASAADLSSQDEQDNQLRLVLHDMDQATTFLAAVNACRFLVEVFDIAQVRSEVERRGGWWQLQTYAAFSWQYQLYELISEDAHFVLLSNVTAFFTKMHAYLPILESYEASCQQSLADLCKRKRLSTKSPAILRRWPQIHVMQERFEAGQALFKMFPRVQPQS